MKNDLLVKLLVVSSITAILCACSRTSNTIEEPVVEVVSETIEEEIVSETPEPEVTEEPIAEEPVEEELVVADLKRGDIIYFGRYEQDNDTSNGMEPIEWLVLYPDFDNNNRLLLSTKALDCYPIRPNGEETFTWENSELREWLNNGFFNVAFNEKEKAMIYEGDVVTKDFIDYEVKWDIDKSGDGVADGSVSIPGEHYIDKYLEDDNKEKYTPTITTDRVFLISEEELNENVGGMKLNKYFVCTPTEYAKAQEKCEFQESGSAQKSFVLRDHAYYYRTKFSNPGDENHYKRFDYLNSIKKQYQGFCFMIGGEEYLNVVPYDEYEDNFTKENDDLKMYIRPVIRLSF